MKDQKPVMVIFGATGGIGNVLSRQLAAAGHKLVLAARQEERLQQLAVELGAEAVTCDATQSTQVDAVITRAQAMHGRIDGVASCIGSILLKPAHLTTDEEWQRTLEQNLTTSFYILRAVAKVMRSSGGSIVFCSSVAAQRGLANHEAIAAAKAGVTGLMLAAAATYASSKIRVNCVAPSLTRTPLSTALTANASALNASLSMHALGRIGEPEDVASAIKWLLDPAQSWVTGQVIGVDGGLGSVSPRPRI
jgi:3-oxoacyl-[acyl-carrier protein] reductase